MTPEQLQAVRAERWRQKSDPVLTLDDAAAWVNTTGLCLFLPRRNQFLTPAPSFAETTIGAPSDMPALSAIGQAYRLMIRLVESAAALPLNLFGALSEQPDFLVSREAFPYVFSLRGGRNWKTPPPKATPLGTAIWKLLEDGVSLEATEIQAALGHEITEAAVLRSLMDLWGGLRVTPLFVEDGPTRWALTQTRFEDALKAANNIAQTTALSALVSLYLESVLAATPEEIEIFLSPLTARSKVREVVNGLAATRQLGMVPVGTQTMYHIAGSLPEFEDAELEVSEAAPVRAPRRERPSFEKRPPERRSTVGRERREPRRERPQREGFAASGGEGQQRRKPFGAGRGDRPPFRKFEERKAGGKYPRREERAGAERRPFGNRPFERSRGDRTEGEERPKFRSDRGKFPPKKFGTGGGKFPPKKFGKPKFGEGKRPDRPWKREEGASSGDRPSRPRREGSFGSQGKQRPYEGREKRPFFRSQAGEQGKFEGRSGAPERTGPPRREWKDKPSGFSKPGKHEGSKFGGGRPGGSKFGGKKSGFSGKKFGGPASRGKSGGARPGFKSGPKPGGSRPPFKKRKDKGNKGKRTQNE